MTKSCKVCKKELPDEKFGTSYHTNKQGERVSYKDSTCMVCRRQKHLENPANKEMHRKGAQNWYRNNPEKAKEQRLRRYKITLLEYNQLREAQDYRCACCGRHETAVEQGRSKTPDTALNVDHCHTTGKVRGLLCVNCNTLLGKSKDDISVLESAIRYLKETK